VNDLLVFNEIGQIRSVSGQGFDNGVAQVVRGAESPFPYFR